MHYPKLDMLNRKITILLTLFSLLLFSLFVAEPARAQLGLEETAGRAGLYNSKGDNPSLVGLVGNVVAGGLSLISVIFFVFIIYGGFRWMLAKGNDQEIQKAQDTIISSVIGIIVILSAYAITSFVFKALTGDSILSGGSSSGTKKDSSGPVCNIYKEFHNEFACIAIAKCDSTMQTIVVNAYSNKKLGENPNLQKWVITGVCPGKSNIVCCIPKLKLQDL